MVKIDNYLVKILSRLNRNPTFIQFPVNLRIFYNDIPEGYKDKEYNVDELHCDHWSGSPLDSLNGFLYILKNEKSPELIFHEFDESKLSLIKNYRGNYKNSPKIKYKKRFTIKPENGIINIWDCIVPHNIIRNNCGVTISIDFRIRDDSKIFYDDLKKDENKYWLNSKMGSLGIYWLNTSRRPLDFEEKIELELKNAINNYPIEFFKKKKKYIEMFYK